MIPSEEIWRSVLCPFCGERLRIYFEVDPVDEVVVGWAQGHTCPGVQRAA